MDVFEPDVETVGRTYDEQIEETIKKAQAGEQARILLNSDLGKEVRAHIVIRQTRILDDIANLELSDTNSMEQLKNLQFEYKVIKAVTDIMALLIVQSDEAIKLFEQLQQQHI